MGGGGGSVLIWILLSLGVLVRPVWASQDYPSLRVPAVTETGIVAFLCQNIGIHHDAIRDHLFLKSSDALFNTGPNVLQDCCHVEYEGGIRSLGRALNRWVGNLAQLFHGQQKYFVHELPFSVFGQYPNTVFVIYDGEFAMAIDDLSRGPTKIASLKSVKNLVVPWGYWDNINPRTFRIDDSVRVQNGCVCIGKSYLSGIMEFLRLFYRFFDQTIGLASRGNHLLPLSAHPHSLSRGFSRLMLDEFERPTQQNYLQNPDSNQEKIESPSTPVGQISLRATYRHGGKFADDYGVLTIILCLPMSGIMMAIGLLVGCPRRLLAGGRRWWGFVLFGFGLLLDIAACLSGAIGCLPWDWWHCLHDGQEHSQYDSFHGDKLYYKKFLTTYTFCTTVSDMANILPKDKQIAIIGALAEGSSIRSIERITGVHRDTIMRLAIRVGKGCEVLLDSKMQNLDCNYLQFDEVWGFIGKKEKHCSVDDNPELGDVWTYCAIDSETKLVPSFKCGKRTLETTAEFVQDVASRMRHRVQVSSDAMHSYIEAMEQAFGADVDYGQCVKVYAHDSAHHPEHKYSAPSFASAYRRPIAGNPEMEFVSTSHVERLNATTRLHVKRLSRLTLAFSKKLDNFKAAVALHFAYYNFVKRHNSLRCTPAMAGGVERDFLTVGDLVDVAV
jgi:IS1 family transposase